MENEMKPMNCSIEPGVSIDDEVLVCRSENNSVYTTSLDIADKFGREHKNILKAIKLLLSMNDTNKNNFYETTYRNTRNKLCPMYCITKNGFILLVMKFTGDVANEWKEKYMNAFNRMERVLRYELTELKKQIAMTPRRGTKEFFAMAYADACDIIKEQDLKIQGQVQKIQGQEKYIQAQQQQLKIQEPAVKFHQAVAETTDCILIRELAKVVQQSLVDNNIELVRANEVGGNRLYRWLRENHWIIKSNSKDRNTPTQRSIDKGYMRLVETPVDLGNGKVMLTRTGKVTPKGQMFFISKILKLYQNGGSILSAYEEVSYEDLSEEEIDDSLNALFNISVDEKPDPPNVDENGFELYDEGSTPF